MVTLSTTATLTFARRMARLLLVLTFLWNIIPGNIVRAQDYTETSTTQQSQPVCGTFPFPLRRIMSWDDFSLSRFLFDLPAGRYSIGVSGNSIDLIAAYMVNTKEQLESSPFNLNDKDVEAEEADNFANPWVYFEETKFPVVNSAVDIIDVREQTALYFAPDHPDTGVDSFEVTIKCLDGKKHFAPAEMQPELESAIPTATLLPTGTCQPSGFFSNLNVEVHNTTPSMLEVVYIVKDGGSGTPLLWIDWVRPNDTMTIGVPVGQYYFYVGCFSGAAKALFTSQTGLSSIEYGR